MNLIYFPRAFESKPDGSEVYKSKRIFRTEINSLNEVTHIYELGYAFRLENESDKTQFIVIDIDECEEGTREAIKNYIDKNKLNDNWYCNYSSSKKETKCKVFKWLDNEIEATKANLENATKTAFDELKSFCGYFLADVVYDEHQVNNPRQLTYGLPRNAAFCNSEFNGLSAKSNDIDDKWISATESKVEVTKIIAPIITIFEKENENGHQIAITKSDIHKWLKNWYYNKYNQNMPVMSTYNIIAKTYTPYMQCARDVDGTILSINQCIVSDGMRHYVADKIIDVIAFNAFSRACFYNDIPSISDCMNRFNWLTSKIFENKDGQPWYKSVQDKYKNKCISRFKYYISNVNFDSWTSGTIEELLEFIAINNDNMDAQDIQWTYRPVDRELQRFTKDVDYMNAACEFAMTHTYYEIWDAIGNDCEGDEMLMLKLLNAIRRRVDVKIPKIRSDKGCTHKEHKEHKERCDKGSTHKPHKEHKTRSDKGLARKEYKERTDKGRCLFGFERIGDKVIIERALVTPAIRKYCSKNKITIERV